MTADEHDAPSHRLREQLDRELAHVRSSPADLEPILQRAQRAPHSGPVAPWVLSAAAVLVVALAVPVLLSLNDADSDRTSPARPVVGAALGTSPAATPAQVVPHQPVLPTAAEAPASRPPSAAAGSPTRVPQPCPTAPATGGHAVAFDIDGDGRADAVAAPGLALVVRLSSGGGGSFELGTASPYVAVLPVEADGTAGSEVLVVTRGPVGKSGAVAQNATLYDLRNCALQPVDNVQGKPYVFEVGSAGPDALFGVSCHDGALFGNTSTGDAQGYLVTSRSVSISRGRAVNGAAVKTVVEAGDPGVPLLSQATCGSATPQSLD